MRSITEAVTDTRLGWLAMRLVRAHVDLALQDWAIFPWKEPVRIPELQGLEDPPVVRARADSASEVPTVTTTDGTPIVMHVPRVDPRRAMNFEVVEAFERAFIHNPRRALGMGLWGGYPVMGHRLSLVTNGVGLPVGVAVAHESGIWAAPVRDPDGLTHTIVRAALRVYGVDRPTIVGRFVFTPDERAAYGGSLELRPWADVLGY